MHAVCAHIPKTYVLCVTLIVSAVLRVRTGGGSRCAPFRDGVRVRGHGYQVLIAICYDKL